MRKELYVYPARFDYEEDGISIEFPDLPGCFSSADTTEEAIKNAEEALGLYLYNLEEDSEKIPEATAFEKVEVMKTQKVVLVKTWMPLVRQEIENHSVKKTLTIPQWLNVLAEQQGVNFSQVLQAALKQYLGVSEKARI